MVSIPWKSSSIPGFRRAVVSMPAFDCGLDGRDCKHEKKGAHGMHCTEWHFYAARLNYGLCLHVYVGDYPEREGGHIPERLKKPYGAAMVYHSAELMFKGQTAHENCSVIEVPCYSDASYVSAEAFYNEHGHGTPEETEEFWLALEARCNKT